MKGSWQLALHVSVTDAQVHSGGFASVKNDQGLAPATGADKEKASSTRRNCGRPSVSMGWALWYPGGSPELPTMAIHPTPKSWAAR